jgi:hypothetical protein
LKKENKKMRKLIALVVSACFSAIAFGQQPNQPAKPGPELKKLAVYVGQWRYEGESKPGPLGPAAKFTGDATGEMILQGFFLEWRWKGQGTTEVTRGVEILSYNPVNKNYSSSSHSDDGSLTSGEYVLGGNTSNFAGKLVVGGRQYGLRATEVFAANLMTITRKEEISVDGKTWIPSADVKFTKLKPEPKK